MKLLIYKTSLEKNLLLRYQLLLKKFVNMFELKEAETWTPWLLITRYSSSVMSSDDISNNQFLFLFLFFFVAQLDDYLYFT